jgi:hypothetical protein
MVEHAGHVGVAQAGQQARLTGEHGNGLFALFGVERLAGQELLQGAELPLEAQVAGQEDAAHAAPADLPDDFVAALEY